MDSCTACGRASRQDVERAVQDPHYVNTCEQCGRPLRQHDLIEKTITGPDEVR